MSKQTQYYQGGSILRYSVIGGAVALVLVATVYVVVQRGQQVRQDQAIGEASQIASQDKPVDVSPPVTDEDQTATDDVAPETVSATDQLPVTGPESDVLDLVGIGALTAAISSYVLSRRTRRLSL